MDLLAILKLSLQILLVIVSLLLILFVLLQRGRGGGLSDMFGGGVTSSLGSSGVALKNVNVITVTLALIWILGIIAVGILTRIEVSAL